jgi:tripartite-type tricarboxylate transporter receptor subunit TctC
MIRTSLAVASLLLAAAAAAQEFPSKAIRMIVTNSPGTTPDTVARTVATEMSKFVGQPVVVENKPGANSTIGYEYVAKQAPADGHTIALVGVSELANLPWVVKNLRFDPLKDLPPFIGLAEGRLIFGTSASHSWKTFQELAAHAKANPGKLNFGAPTSQVRFPMQVLLQDLGADVTYIAYSGGGPYILALATGEIHMGLIGEAAAISLGDKLRVLAVTGRQRSPSRPEVPTLAELGHPRIQGLAFSLNAAQGIPKAAQERLHAAAARALQQPDLRERFSKIGLEIQSERPEAAAKSLADGAKMSADVAKRLGIQPQ